MSILPSAILALRSGGGKPAPKPLPLAVVARAGAGAASGPTDSSYLPSAVLAKKVAPPPDIPPVIKDPSDPKPKRRSKKDMAMEARASASARIRALVDEKPGKGKIYIYMMERIKELNAAAD